MRERETHKSFIRYFALGLAATLLISACRIDQKNSLKPETKYDNYSDIFSSLLASEDSSLVQVRSPWKLTETSDGKFRFVKDTGETRGSEVYISIFDRYRIPHLVNTYELQNGTNLYEKVSEELINKMVYNKDTSKFEVKIKGKHKYLLFNEDLLKKPHFTIEELPRKYVKSYCKVGLSKPILDSNQTSCLVYMENYCSDDGKIYYMKKREKDWVVVKSSFSTSLVAPM
jgi:hypothetical protein